jgi:formylglycine-generating enzyme required for sulfatase activity
MKLRSHVVLLSLLAALLLAWGGTHLRETVHRGSLRSQEYEPPPLGMVFVPAGEFWMGSDDPNAEPDEKPLRKVFVPPFYIDRFEVTNRRYKELMADHRYPAGEDDLPVAHVLKRRAEEFCRMAGRRLPTAAEWEKAARGTDGRVYPWGNEFSADRANINRRVNAHSTNASLCNSPFAVSRGKLPGGSFPNGASPYGCQDLAGNVWEWVSDVWVERSSIGINPSGEARGIIRGGAYSYSPKQARTSYQGFEALETTCHDVGFRCAMDAVPKRK